MNVQIVLPIETETFGTRLDLTPLTVGNVSIARLSRLTTTSVARGERSLNFKLLFRINKLRGTLQ